LKAQKIDFEHLGMKGWKSGLGEKLGEQYQLISPRMPNANNAKYIEWKIWFEKFFPLIHDDVILLGHSLGASFLAKYLSEETFPKKIKATFLIAAPYDEDGNRDLIEFAPAPSLERFAKQGGEIFLYHSKDDPVVPFSEFVKYQKVLPKAHVQIFEDRQHFNQEEFPELVEDLKKV
jgi:predicted alpha/beta hydrolase family esterase